jgi:hypothetical protein
MKKIAFGILVLISLFFLFMVVMILLFDLSRLTEWGYGYLTGSIIYLAIFVGLSILLGYRIFRPR